MRCEIELAPSGCLRLITPTGRFLEIEANTAAVALLRRILYHAEQHKFEPVAFPTQHVLDAWARGKPIDWSRREPVVQRTVLGDAEAKPKKKAKPKLKAFGHEKVKIDLSKVEFEL